MKCKKCGEKIEKDFKACPNCGSLVNFTPIDNIEDEIQLIKTLGDKKKKRKNPMIFVIGLVTLIAGAVGVVSFVFAGNSLFLFSNSGTADYEVDYEKMKKEQRQETLELIEKGEITTDETTNAPTVDYNLYYTTQYPEFRSFPLSMNAFSVKRSNVGLPNIVMRFSNNSKKHTISSITVRFIAYDENDKKIYVGNANAEGQFDKTFKVKVKPGAISENIKLTLNGCKGAKKVYYKFISARSSDGFIYSGSGEWRHAEVKK